MLLSNLEIHKALDEGRLVIDPEPLPRVKGIGDKYCPYDSHTVDLKLGSEITVPKPGTFAYDFKASGSIADLIAQNSEKHILTEHRPYHLMHGQFILAQTLETITLPIDKGPPYLAARIEGKSSRARCGLLVHFTAPTVHPEWSGPLTLEIINLSKTPFILHVGMPIAQLIVEQVAGEIISNLSQFHDQTTPEGKP
ncbi:MAG: dCTP deaminase [Planctomycetes bacterium]|nr:dCTP deaminase [Planctomycetota bacterium]